MVVVVEEVDIWSKNILKRVASICKRVKKESKHCALSMSTDKGRIDHPPTDPRRLFSILLATHLFGEIDFQSRQPAEGK